jgi:hypothetical protein
MRVKSIFLLLFSFRFLSLCAQVREPASAYPQSDFRQPLDLPPALAGNFAEIRANHLHSGLDYRTNQRQGYPVYAAADGIVSRLRVQIGGGGNIVYIDHPNGYTTVYMHLQRFSPKIATSIRSYQYYSQTFNVDFAPVPGAIPVKKGEIIAWSGNTGATAGPHLHFEIRDTKTEETINAQLFGIDIPDRVKPMIRSMYLYRLGEKPFSEWTPRQYFQVVGASGNYRLNKSPVIQVNGKFGFGLVSDDQSVAGGNKNGIYSMELQMDGKTVFRSAMERFSFAASRGVNAYIDYPALLSQNVTIQKAFLEPGNPLRIYGRERQNGIVTLTDDAVHHFTFLVSDIKGNTSLLNFNVRSNPAATIAVKEPEAIKQFTWNSDNLFEAPGVKVLIPKGNLYSDLAFRYETSARTAGSYSPVHHIHNRLIPVHDSYILRIKPDSTLAGNLYSKAVIVDSRGISQGGTEDNGFIRATPRYFGNFCIRLDTVPPTIVPLNISDGKAMASATRISLRISDNLSGIHTFNGYIDGKWVLMEFDNKTSTLFYTFEGPPANERHTFRVSVTDYKQNERIYNANFVR